MDQLKNQKKENIVGVPESSNKNDEAHQSVLNNCDLFDSEQWNFESDVNERVIEIPVTTSKNVSLTGVFDDCQVYIVCDDTYAMVIIKKVSFKDKQKFISGCNLCYNLNTNFLIFLADSQAHDSELSTNLAKCKHIKLALSEILNSFNCWQPSITEYDLQKFLEEYLIWENTSRFFVSEKNSIFCGCLSLNDGILLFVLKNGKWRCVADKYQVASKCRHGQLLDFPDKDNDEIECCLEPEPNNIEISSQLLSSKCFIGEYNIISETPFEFFTVSY